MFEIVATFQDENMPAIRQDEKTLLLAHATASHFSKNFASLKSISIKNPDGSKDVYNGRGLYYFTVPAEGA